MIDLRTARHDPDATRAALERRGAGAAFDELIAADERWRELVPKVDELRARQKLDGKPTPEQLERLRELKEQLRDAEEQLSAAESARDAALAKVPNVPDPSAADGFRDEDAIVVRMWGEPSTEPAPEHLELANYDMERGAKVSGARFGFIIGDAAKLSLALYRLALDRLIRGGFKPVLPPVLVREEATRA
jgi:seryl-tRNA synthetase